MRCANTKGFAKMLNLKFYRMDLCHNESFLNLGFVSVQDIEIHYPQNLDTYEWVEISVRIQARLTLDRASRQSRNDLFLEENKHDERWNRNDNYIREKQVPLRGKLTYKAIQGKLDGYVIRSRQEVEW